MRAPSRIRWSRARRASRSATPFASPKVSQASQSGSTVNPTKVPKPAIAWCGAFSLKKNGVPGTRLKRRVEGRQKLASRTPGWLARRSHQFGSVTATKPSIARG